jgi:ribosomal protein S18 acetylase RimI-like enzyme
MNVSKGSDAVEYSRWTAHRALVDSTHHPRSIKTTNAPYNGLPTLQRSLTLMQERWQIVLEEDPDPSLRSKILEPLSKHNELAGGPTNWNLLAVTVRDQNGEVVGGLWGRSGYGFLFVELLALGPAKGAGLGREVMLLAEAEAKRRGLLGIWLDTWTFQAPGFYQKLGYIECGRITDYPPGHDRIFYMKRFA